MAATVMVTAPPRAEMDTTAILSKRAMTRDGDSGVSDDGADASGVCGDGNVDAGELCDGELGCDPLTCYPKMVSIVGVDAVEDDGHVPENTLDGDLTGASYWAARGEGKWIQYHFSDVSMVNEVRISFISGASRVSTFSVATSLNGEDWSVALDHVDSSGATDGYETFNFPLASAQHLRIIGYGSSTGTGWNSIYEVRIMDFPIDLPACVPLCVDECGDDGCGGSCGTCDGGTCVEGQCQLNTAERGCAIQTWFRERHPWNLSRA